MPRALPEIIADPVFQGFTAQEKLRVLTAVDPLFSKIDPNQQYQAVKAASEGGWQAYHPYRMQGYEKIKPEAVPGYAERHPILEVGLKAKENLFRPIPSLLGAPTLSKQAEEILPESGQVGPLGGVKQAIGMTGRVAAGVGDFVTSPGGLALLAAGVFGGPIVAAGLGIGFAATLGKDSIQAGIEFYKHPSPENAERFIVSLGLAGLPWAHSGVELKKATARVEALKSKGVAKEPSPAQAGEPFISPEVLPKEAVIPETIQPNWVFATGARPAQPGMPLPSGPPVRPQRRLPPATTTVGPEVFEPAYQTGRESRIGPAWQRPTGPYIAPSARPERFERTGRKPAASLPSPAAPVPGAVSGKMPRTPVQPQKLAPPSAPTPTTVSGRIPSPPAAPIYGAAKGKLAERIKYLEAEVKAIAPEKVAEAQKLARGDASAYADLLDLGLAILERAKEKPVRPFEPTPEQAGGPTQRAVAPAQPKLPPEPPVAQAGPQLLPAAPQAREGAVAPQEAAAPAAPEIVPLGTLPGLQTYEPGKLYRMEVSDLGVDPERFQFRIEPNQRIEGQKVFDQKLAGPIDAWVDPATGKPWVVEGHGRMQIAKRTGAPNIDVIFMDELTAEAARARAALKNIAQGHATAFDAAKFFRDTKMTPEDLAKRGIGLGVATARQGMGLARLDDYYFNEVVMGKIPEGRAAIIGNATNDVAKQEALFQAIEKRETKGQKVSDGTAEEMARRIDLSSVIDAEQIDLFGNKVVRQSTAVETAEVSDFVRKQISGEKNLFGGLKTQAKAERLAVAGNVLDVKENARIAERASQDLAVYDKLSEKLGPVNDILNAAGERLAKGEDANAVKRSALEAVRQEIQSALGRGERPRSTGGAEGHPIGGAIPASQTPISFGESNTLFTKAASENLKQELKAGLDPNTLRAGLDPELMLKAAKLGGYYIEGGLREFGAWSEAMVRDVGEAIRPYLRQIYTQAIAAGKSASQNVEDRMIFRTAEVHSQVQDALKAMTPEAKIIQEEGTKTFERGTVPKERQEEFYGPARPELEATYEMAISQRIVDESRISTEQARIGVEAWLQEVESAGDAVSINAGKAALEQLNTATKYFREIGTVSGRILQMRQKKAGIPPPGPPGEIQRVREGLAPGRQAPEQPLPTNLQDLARQARAAIESADNLLRGVQRIKGREPLDIQVYKGIRDWHGSTNADKIQTIRAIADEYRFNLFSPFSFVFDLAGNTAEIGGQIAGAVGHDIVYTARTGQVSFPSLKGFMEAVRERAERRFIPMNPDIEAALGFSLYGERLPLLPGQQGRRLTIGGRLEKPGIFTYRKGIGEEGTALRKVTKPLSAGYDVFRGATLYSKGAIDTTAKRLAATATLWRDAAKLADARKITESTARRRFIREFVDNPPDWAKQEAITNGNKAGMNRPLGPIAKKWSQSLFVRLLVEPFPGWAPQFLKWAGEMVGYNKPLLGKLIKGEALPEEVGGYLTKTAAGIGGLYFLSQVIYPHVDFNSMEYVHDDGNRTRISNLDPTTTGLIFLAALKGDAEKFAAGLPYASIPGVKLMPTKQTGFPAGGGILGGAIGGLSLAINNPQNDPRALERELTLMLNRSIPGQAMLGAAKTILDPVQREGAGANLPIVSLSKEPRIQLTTGEPRTPRQTPPFPLQDVGTFPQVQGVPIPGARRILDPIEKLLSHYELTVYRPLRQPIAGSPAANVLPEHRQEWEIEFGKQRQQILGPIAKQDEQGAFKMQPREQVRKMISGLDSLAARIATLKVNERHGNKPRPPARLNPRMLAGPEIYQQQGIMQ